MSDYNSTATNMLTILEEETEQLELDLKKKKCAPDEFWCDIDKKCIKKDRGGHPHGGINEGHDFAMYDKLKSELLMKLQMSGVDAADGGGNSIVIGKIIVRIEGVVNDKTGLGGAAGTKKLSFD